MPPPAFAVLADDAQGDGFVVDGDTADHRAGIGFRAGRETDRRHPCRFPAGAGRDRAARGVCGSWRCPCRFEFATPARKRNFPLRSGRGTLLAEPDTHEARFVGRNAVLERIFHERNPAAWAALTSRRARPLRSKRTSANPFSRKGLQGDILVDGLHLLAERYEIAIGVVVCISSG